MTSKTPQEALLKQPAGIRSLVAALVEHSGEEGFTLRRCGSQSAIGNVEIGLVCGPHALQTLTINLGDAAEQALADRRGCSTIEDVAALANFYIEYDNLPTSVSLGMNVLVARGFQIASINRLSTMTTAVLYVGRPVTGIRVEMTWL